MSKIFEALLRAEAERDAATAVVPPSAAPEHPPDRTWRWSALCGVLALGATALVIGYLFGSQRATHTATAVVSTTRPNGNLVRGTDRDPEGPAIETRGAEPPSVLGVPMPPTVVEVPTAAIPSGADAGGATPPASADVPAATAASPEFWVQLGAFRERANADGLAAELERQHQPVVVRAGRLAGVPWMVRVGPFPDRRAADTAGRALELAGRAGFVIRE